MYIPILKNRTIEMKVLEEIVGFLIPNKTIPLIEIVQQFARSNSKQDYVEEISNIFKGKTNRVFIDIVRSLPVKSTTEPVRDFLLKVNRIPNFAVDQLIKFREMKNAIPVLSYNSQDFNEKVYLNEVELLRKSFSSLAFRITSNSFKEVFPLVVDKVTNHDFILLDIESASHSNPALKVQYRQIKNLKKIKGVSTIILNDPRSSEITNKSLIDGEPILEIDNSLMETYNLTHYGFDGFGDYAGITSALPSSGGTISPAGIYYSKENNFFIGYKGRKPELSEFDYIAKKITESVYWKEFNMEHHNECPGCQTILRIVNKEESGRNQAKWKGITMLHYIYTVNESFK